MNPRTRQIYIMILTQIMFLFVCLSKIVAQTDTVKNTGYNIVPPKSLEWGMDRKQVETILGRSLAVHSIESSDDSFAMKGSLLNLEVGSYHSMISIFEFFLDSSANYVLGSVTLSFQSEETYRDLLKVFRKRYGEEEISLPTLSLHSWSDSAGNKLTIAGSSEIWLFTYHSGAWGSLSDSAQAAEEEKKNKSNEKDF